MDFLEKLRQRQQETQGCLCVGLDPRPSMLAEGESLAAFCLRVAEEVAPYTAAFKPNLAYFEAYGSAGLQEMEVVLKNLPKEIPVILDAKRGDIGTTQQQYAKAIFETWQADAVTVSPYMGFDSVEPMLQYSGKGVYILAVTSNPGAADLERQQLASGGEVWQIAADFAARAKEYPADAGLVLGLTNAQEVLSQVPDLPLLIPGLGAQGGNVDVLHSNPLRSAPLLVNVSRGILAPKDDKPHIQHAQIYAQSTASLVTSNR